MTSVNHQSPHLRAFLLISVLFFANCNLEKIHTLQGETMGTTWQVKVKAANFQAAKTRQNIVESLNQSVRIFSTYEQDSEISRLNRAPAGVSFAISNDLQNVLSSAIEISKVTLGQYDVTVGPLVNLWGFGPGNAGTRPAADEIKKAMLSVGYQNLQRKPGFVLKRHANTYIDLSSIAKGYAIDKVAELLLLQGYRNFMVDIGGDLKANGDALEGPGWRIGIEKPILRLTPGKKLQRIIRLQNMGLATSGDYRNFQEHDGEIISHTISPLTGRPVKNNIASVTVVAESAMLADGYATAIMSLASPFGLEQLKLPKGIEYFMIIRENDKSLTEKYSPGFEKLIL